jgi:hypothetical protein
MLISNNKRRVKKLEKMAVLAAAALLDELMGRNRNIAPNDKAKELNWEDPEVSCLCIMFCVAVLVLFLVCVIDSRSCVSEIM